MDNLQFRRQFLFSAKECNQLDDWKNIELGKHILYVHPDCGLTSLHKDSIEIAMIGYAIDPDSPKKTDADILQDIAVSKSINDIPEKLYGLTGRFVLIIKLNDDFFFFHDACGLRSIFYTRLDGNLYAASQPLLLNLVIKLQKSRNYDEYYNSLYVKNHKEHFLPSGISLYDNVYQLVPNHYLDYSKFRQIRYWPKKPIGNIDFEEGVLVISKTLKNILLATRNRFKLALPMTAGWDSRIIFSACKDFADQIFFYTEKYDNLTNRSADIKIPSKLLTKLGYQHHVLDCRKFLDKDFSDIYLNNTDIPHHDWLSIINGMYNNFPPDRINIKGNCSEIARCAYYHSGKHQEVTSSNSLLNLNNKWKQINFIEEQITEWLEEINDTINLYGYDILDLFYWEHKMGSWQAQSQLEGDIIHETFTPFNNRKLLEIMLSIDIKYRCRENRYSLLYTKVINTLWKETLSEPVNPKSNIQKIKIILKKTLIQMGIFYSIKKFLTKKM